MMPRGRPRKARTADATQTDLENNKLRHETTHKCDLCLITFLKESLYRIHLHKHEKTDKPYHCDQCSMSFNIEYNLTLHKLTHGLNDASCPVCNKNFNRVASLKAHIMSHMKEETLVCTECGDEFILQSQLSLHMEEHQQESMGSKTYSCVSCEESFKTPLLLKEHIKTHVKIRVVRAKADNRNIDRSGFRYSCPHCGKKFKRRDQVTCHAMIHTGDKPFKCTLCRKAFIQKSVLVTHIATHTGEKPHSCSLCPSSFSQKGTLQSHLQKVHSEVKNGVSFQCTHCNCVFKSVGSRSRHINKMHGTRSEGTSTSTEGAAHMTLAKASVSETECLANQTGDEKENRDAAVSVPEGNNAKRNICTYCNKEFKKPSCLVKHIRIHTREKPFKCKECFRGFASKGNLTAHMKTHTGIKAFNCNCCKKRFSTSGSLKVHLRLHTGETPYACPHCDKKFKTYGLRETHITTHLTPCELKNLREQRKLRKVCPRKPVISMSEITLEEPILVSKLGIMQPIPRGRQFFQEALINSYAYEVDRPHKCSHCPRAYKKSCELKLHIRYHTGEKPYNCTQCGRAFPSSGSLKIHMRTHTGLKPYKCPKCSRAFSTSGCLRRHMVIHNDVRSYMCPYCQKTFKTFPNCKSHLRTHRYEVARQLQQNQLAASEETSANVSDQIKVETENNELPLDVTTHQDRILQRSPHPVLDTVSTSVCQVIPDEKE